MNRAYRVVGLVVGMALSGCATKEIEPPKEKIVVQATETDAILACVAGKERYSRKTFNSAFKAALANATRADSPELPPLICLSLHQQATTRQFKEGMDVLVRHLKKHPESATSLQGLSMLIQQLDKERVVKRLQSSKSQDEKEGLEAENKDLAERNESLEKNAVQDQSRIKELQQQIEQLKNIENIIKNRER